MGGRQWITKAPARADGEKGNKHQVQNLFFKTIPHTFQLWRKYLGKQVKNNLSIKQSICPRAWVCVINYLCASSYPHDQAIP